mmetsp:Transcript_30973/g.47832  ORF Transcript_30973/g.47832 Transcript_30973/m.47832 type:complete len:228 (-) Transcript_30973:940-1623(-)
MIKTNTTVIILTVNVDLKDITNLFESGTSLQVEPIVQDPAAAVLRRTTKLFMQFRRIQGDINQIKDLIQAHADIVFIGTMGNAFIFKGIDEDIKVFMLELLFTCNGLKAFRNRKLAGYGMRQGVCTKLVGCFETTRQIVFIGTSCIQRSRQEFIHGKIVARSQVVVIVSKGNLDQKGNFLVGFFVQTVSPRILDKSRILGCDGVNELLVQGLSLGSGAQVVDDENLC